MDPIAQQLVSRLRQDPLDARAYESLKAHYYAREDFAAAAELLEGWGHNHAHDPLQASQAYVEAARCVLQATGDAERARGLYERALAVNVLHPEAAHDLVALIEQQGDANALFDMLERYAQGLEAVQADPALIGSVYARLAQLCEQTFARPDLAAPYHERAAAYEAMLSPQAGAAASTSAGGDVLAQLEQELEHEHDVVRRIELYCELARLHVDTRSDVEKGIAVLRRALAETPGDVQIMHQLASYLLMRADTATPEAAQADHKRVAELFYRIAQGVDDAQAIVYLESALGSLPSHEGAMSMLELLCARHHQQARLALHWVAFVASAPDGPETDARRVKLGEAYLQASQVEDAIECLRPAAERGSDRAHELLQRAYGLQARMPRRAVEPIESIAPEPIESMPAPEPDDEPEHDALPTLRPIEDALAQSSPPSAQPATAHEPEPSGLAIAAVHDAQAEAEHDALPTLRPPRRERVSEGPDDAQRLQQLRKQLHEQIAARQHDESAATCQQMLALDANDAEAFGLLETYYRKRRDHAGLRELLLASTRSPGLSIEARKVRLREVAALCETKLREPEGAISAWRGVVTLDPADRDGVRNLKRLLKKAELWDELAGVLDSEIAVTADLTERVALLQELVALHRDKRKDPADTAEALRQLHALRPKDATVRDELCELSLQLEQYEEAAHLLREQADTTSDEREKHRAQMQLAALLHDKLTDPEGAYQTCEAVLDHKPNDKACFELMERIDTELGNFARLLRTLERRAQGALKSERPELLARLGRVADEELHDFDKAAHFYGEALDLTPNDAEALERLASVFERAERHQDLVELLRERVLIEKNAIARANLYRRIATVLTRDLGDDAGAAEAYEKLLQLEPDEAALRFLRDVATMRDDSPRLASLLEQLIALVQDPTERRDFAFERAELLADRLEQSTAALTELRRIVTEVDPDFEPAIAKLEALATDLNDEEALMLALSRRLPRAQNGAERVRTAKKLAALCGDAPARRERAIEALQAWAAADERDPEPHRQLRARLQGARRPAELLASLDALGTWEDDPDARDGAVVEAARVAFEELGEVDSAWKRLAPLVEEQHEGAEALLVQVARKAGRAAPLSALYVQLAQQADEPKLQAAYWRKAAETYERDLGQPDKAFEAALRMLAADMADRSALTIVDRLAVANRATKRLTQVYERLLREAVDDADKVDLLVRHGEAIVGSEPDEALDLFLRACALAPEDEVLVGRTEQLALEHNRSEELLVVYDRRRARASTDVERVRALLRAAQLCDGPLRERERANQYLKQALVAAQNDEQRTEVERTARALDVARPELGADQARRALVRAYRELAERASAEFASTLFLRSAELLRIELQDERGAFDALRQGVATRPLDEPIYVALLELAELQKRLDAVDAHLSRLADDSIESEVTVTLLRRRGRLLEGALARPKDAAAVYAKLLQLRPADAEATNKVRASLRAAGRYQELLLALDKQLQRTREPEERLALLHEIASTWENDLKNRWEAIDAWKAVLTQHPGDETALVAMARLNARPSSYPSAMSTAARSETASTEAAPSARTSEPGTRASEPNAELDAPASASELSVPAASAEPDEDEAEEHPTVPPPAVAKPEPSAQLPAVVKAAPAAEHPAAADEDDAADDLAALDADLVVQGRSVQEVDFLEDEPLDDAIEPPRRSAPPTPPRRSAPPPAPPAAARTSSPGSITMPRPSSPGAVPSAPATPSMPPPLPSMPASAARVGAAPPRVPARPSMPPPLPGKKPEPSSAGEPAPRVSMPPPLPRKNR